MVTQTSPVENGVRPDLWQLNLVTFELTRLVLADRVAHSPFPGAAGIRQQFCLIQYRFPFVTARIVKIVVIEHFADVVRELAVSIKIDPEIEVVKVSLGGAIGIEHATHGDLRMNRAIAVEFPSMDVLVPATLEFCADSKPCRLEIGGR